MNVKKLALWFSPAVVYGEADVNQLSSYPKIQWGASHEEDFFNALDIQLRSICTSHDRIAVAFSGGVDSAYIYKKCIEFAGDQRVIPIYYKLQNSEGDDWTERVVRIAETLCKNTKLETLETEHQGFWPPLGPPSHTFPGAVAAIEKRASELRATILLTGCGADELLNPAKYQFYELVHKGYFSKAFVTLAHSSINGLGSILEEIVAPLVSFLRGCSSLDSARFALEEACVGEPYSILTPTYRNYVRDWTLKHYEDLLSACASTSDSLSQADAFLSVFPINKRPSITGLPVLHPFLCQNAVKHALQIPLDRRVGTRIDPIYYQRKIILFSRMPSDFLHASAKRKVSYSRAVEQALIPGAFNLEPLINLGLINEDVNIENLDMSTKLCIKTLTAWVSEALARGVDLQQRLSSSKGE